MTQIVGLLGYPITHSISPVFQQAAFDHCSINVSYRKWPTAEEHLKASIERLRGDDYLGANVTIPYKEMIAELVDEVDEVGLFRNLVLLPKNGILRTPLAHRGTTDLYINMCGLD